MSDSTEETSKSLTIVIVLIIVFILITWISSLNGLIIGSPDVKLKDNSISDDTLKDLNMLKSKSAETNHEMNLSINLLKYLN